MHVEASLNTPADDTMINLGALVKQDLSRKSDLCYLRFGTESWTRRRLLDAAMTLAGELESFDLAEGEPVVIEIASSFHLVSGICAVLIAGGVAVPVDPDLSEERRQAVLQDVSPRLVMRTPGNLADISIITRSARPTLAPRLAFLVYTSGSSGAPKGVEISHQSYVGRLKHIVQASPAQPHDVDLLWTPAGFIGMLDEVFFPLFQTIPAVIAPPAARRDPLAFADLIAREAVTTFRITPSLLDVFLTETTAKSFDSVRAIFCSGEILGESVQQKTRDLLSTQLISFYGASEAPGVAYHLCQPEGPATTTPLYSPQDFAKIRVVDPDGVPLAPGEKGEIWIGGLPLAEGYWNRPDLTAEKFIHLGGQDWYRTGDQGTMTTSGQFQVLGRIDQSEVNVLGVRINLVDVCNALRGLEAVDEAWVSAVELPNRKYLILVAHCVPAEGHRPNIRKIRKLLAAILPGAAMPSVLITHDQFPLTANGKLDIRRLEQDARDRIEAQKPPPADKDPHDGEIDSADPEVPHLTAVTEAVEHLLQISGLTGAEDFFNLGGNSLHAVELALILTERLGVELSSDVVFNTKNLREIAEACAGEGNISSKSIRLLRAGRTDSPPLFTINATQNYARLAKALTAPGPVYNLNIFGLTNTLIDRIDTITLQDLAEHLADELMSQHPAGPWQIMAFCQDGCLAVEIGRILQARTGQPGDLLLIDTFFLDHQTSLKMALMRMVHLGPGYYIRKLTRKTRQLMGMSPRNRTADVDTVQKNAALIAKSRNDGRLYDKYVQFFMTYDPPVYAGRVNLFVSSEWKHVNLRNLHEMSEGLTVRHFSGLHNTIFAPKHVEKLARVVDEALGDLARQDK